MVFTYFGRHKTNKYNLVGAAMDIKGIKEFVAKYSLEERSFKGFWDYFNMYQKEHKDDFEKDFNGFNSKEIELFIDTVSLRITNWPEEGYNHIVISVRVHYKGKYMCYYTIVFALNGEVEDDHLSLL
ncbi:hypothetical protein ACFOQM_22760 [Paenibacillus sp. GCM10012307]